jgi:fumarylpyruvate hydrolase
MKWEAPSLQVAGSVERFYVRRIFLIGRNYAEHAKEMGAQVDKGQPVFFMKPADALVCGGAVRYPSATNNLHHEVELVLAIGAQGCPRSDQEAWALVAGYAVGNDLTRRDLQAICKQKSLPWEIAKAFEQSAVVGPLTLTQARIERGRIALWVNGQIKQESDLSDMVFSIPEILIELAKYFELKPGDLVFTGTPAGVGPLLVGDQVRAEIEGVGTLEHCMVASG